MSPGYVQVAFVHILQQEEDYRDEESLIRVGELRPNRNAEVVLSGLPG